MQTQSLVERVLGIAALAVLVIACLMVLRPFISALTLAGILCFSTWPAYVRVERAIGGRRTLAAALMTLLVTLVLIAPFAIVLVTLADNITSLTRLLRTMFDNGLPPAPDWLATVPLVGGWLVDYWELLRFGGSALTDALSGVAIPAAEFGLKAGATIGTGLLELGLAVFIAFFLYRSGRNTAQQIAAALERLVGPRTHHLIKVAGDTVNSVVYGILGTALAQGILAGFGFWIAGVPGALFLGFITFVLSLIPGGPPFVWGPATIWLFWQGEIGWGIFMAAWGFFIVSSVDNLLKPWLISRGGTLPLLLVFLGAFGGILAFGFEGIFLGPTVLAVGFSMLREWTARTAAPAATPPVPAGRTEDGTLPPR